MDDVLSMPARGFFLLAERLPAYGGVVANAVRRSMADRAADGIVEDLPASAEAPNKVLVGPEQAAQMLTQPLYGDIPGLGPAFTYSFAPLAPEGEGTDG